MMNLVAKQPVYHKQTSSPVRRSYRAIICSIGWIGAVLPLVAGCHLSSSCSDRPSTIGLGRGQVEDRCDWDLPTPEYLTDGNGTSHDASHESRVADSEDPASNAASPIRLASLESELPTEGIGPLRLQDAINLALERNLDLAAVRAGEPVAHAALHVAETYPWNPQFQTQVAPYSRDREGNDGSIAQQHVLVQTLELGGQRWFRRGAAAANWEQVISTIRQAELLNAAQTTRLFFGVIYQRELRDMNQSLANLNEQLVGVLQRRENAGLANKADVQLARLQAQSSHRQQRLAEASYQLAVLNLRNHLNLDAHTPLELAGQWVDWRWRTLDDVLSGGLGHLSTGNYDDDLQRDPVEGIASPPADDEATLRQLVVERPDVVAAHAAVAVAMENLRLARASRRPDLQIGPMYQRDEGATEFWGFQATMDIPVVNTGRPLVEQRMAELRQQEIAASQLENRAVLEARTAIQRYERARRFVDESYDESSRDISEVLKPFEDQFHAGQITLLEVLAARTALAQSRRSFLDLLNELALAAADVAQATGLPPQQLLTDDQPQPVLFEEVPLP